MNGLRLTVRGVFAASAICLVAPGSTDSAFAGEAPLPVVQAPFDSDYQVQDLGAVPGVPVGYAGIAFLAGDPNTLLVGGHQGRSDAAVYSVSVTRDGSGHITGFGGPADGFAQYYADAPYIDGGLVYGPGGVLFYTRNHIGASEIGEIKPGSNTTDHVADLAGAGMAMSPGGLNFVPDDFPTGAAGSMKATSYSDGDWFDLVLAALGDGTFDVISASKRADLQPGMEGFSFVPPGSPIFGDTLRWTLINEFNNEIIGAYELDVNGDPTGPRQVFMTDAGGPEGSVFDPITADLIVTDWANDRLYQVTGFTPAPMTPTPTLTPTPTPTPTPVKPLGDVNDDGAVNSIDALLILQFDADLLSSIVNLDSGDVNLNGRINAIDAALILQLEAGLIPGLPPG